MPKVVPFYLTPSFLKKDIDIDEEMEVEGTVKVPLKFSSLKKRNPKEKKDEFILIDTSRENPEFMDPAQLRSFSNRRLWKKRRGYSTQKKRLSRKDIAKGKHI